MNDYQLIIIGTGPGGYVAAVRAAQLGLKTAVVENREIGGTCLNRGCIPTKSLLHAAELYSQMRESALFGLSGDGVGFDFFAVQERKGAVVDKLRCGIEALFKTNKVDVLRGLGTIVGAGSVMVGERVYTADDILIASGSVPSRPPIPGLELPGVFTSDELLGGEAHLLRSLIIIGGGVIGVELAGVYAAFGCEVTVVEAMDRILPTMDKEISQNLSMIFKKRGIKVLAAALVERIEQDGDELVCHLTSKEKTLSIRAENVLVAIGRRPNTQGLLDEGVTLEIERGRIVTDACFRTSMEHVYAIGDVSSKVQLAHAAEAQGIACAEHIAGGKPSVDVSLIPSCIYTSPEIAAVGLTEADCKAQGISAVCGKYVMHSNAKTVIVNGERGFIKVVAEAETGRLLGAQMMCERATDMISELSSAILNGLTCAQLRAVMRPHPTFSEGVSSALESLESTLHN